MRPREAFVRELERVRRSRRRAAQAHKVGRAVREGQVVLRFETG